MTQPDRLDSFDSISVPEDVVAEILQVGAIITPYQLDIGHVFKMRDQPMVVTREITAQEFMDRVKAAGLAHDFRDLPASGAWFYEISVD